MQKYKERSTNKNFRLIQYLVEEQKLNKNKHIKNPLHFYMQWIYNELYTLRDIITTAGTRSVKTMSDPEGGKMPNNSDNKGTPPSKPSDTAE